MSPFFCQVVKACNEGVRKMSRTEQMISIQKKMEFKIKVNLCPSVCPHPAGLAWSNSVMGHPWVSVRCRLH